MGMIIFERLGKLTKGNYRTHIIFDFYNFTNSFQLVSNNNVLNSVSLKNKPFDHCSEKVENKTKVKQIDYAL